ncbi:NADPH oxidase 5 [Thecamonas trahens ATCC 50062]|uniref:NADPH oxidase 5 n=1 Tax=Thecamonas trahens ATCC 50062 TaxID=461836 RepID=A0A0L0DCL6_THETB|nr:NADPH oxidase 5 [Thecamonas trahens ATCC 50062]KNC49861.1 NADPH oxidase 5 [Thecamonas trahens ATCC 50062]|eukprot:XP_013757345.1 NADPH oxidase 5 [Thecamonas trahens ATCC 50062]
MQPVSASERPLTKKERLKNFAVNNGRTTACLIVYMGINVFVFLLTYVRYRTGKNKQVYALLGEGVTIARGAAAMLNFNCSMLLLPVCRNLLTRLRATFVHSIIPLDLNIEFHKFCAWLIAVSVAMHATAHYFNYDTLGDQTKDSSHTLAFGTVAGSTGHIITMCMVLIYTTALEKVRRQCFELFWYTHHLFVIFFGLLIIHGTPSSLQPNQFWGWFLLPGFLYCLERALRVVRGNFDTQIAHIIQHPSSVIEIQLIKPSFRMVAGQYIFLNCPSIARYEWHPFTLTSAPQEETCSVHVRVVGDWTRALAARLGLSWDKSGVPIDSEVADAYGLSFRIDGPFGSASEDVYDYEVAVLVGAGIGVTPFASILKDLWYRVMDVGSMRLSKVYFIWTCRDKSAFEWFADILAALEQEALGDLLEINVFLTAKLSLDEAREIVYAEAGHGGSAGGGDVITGLQSPTYYGRPDFEGLLRRYADRHRTQPPAPPGTIGIFLCGPAVIASKLRYLANILTDVTSGIQLVFNKENF